MWGRHASFDCFVGRVVVSATAGLRFESRVGQSITRHFSVFRKFLSSSTESGIVLMPELSSVGRRNS
uniref:SFRICE_032022 n=1 Tax=Spodoptera frugiperda TaxID=7108 RepID=A0A2H1WF78_SPOFR